MACSLKSTGSSWVGECRHPRLCIQSFDRRASEATARALAVNNLKLAHGTGDAAPEPRHPHSQFKPVKSRHCTSVSSRLLAGAINCRALPCASDGTCAKHPAVVWARGGQMLRAHLPLVCACPCASSHAYAGPSGASHSVRTAIKRGGQECDVAVRPVNGSRAHTPRRLRGPCWKSRLIRGTGRGVGSGGIRPGQRLATP